MNKDTQKTHFGFQTINIDEKIKAVEGVFSSVASKYDIMNDVMSFGVHRLWKQAAIQFTGLKPGDTVLDLAGGTGDLAAKLYKKVGEEGHVTVCDYNAAMLQAGRAKLLDRGIGHKIEWTQGDGHHLPFADNAFNAVTCAFGLRNMTDQKQALTSMNRVVKPGGRVMILEFSKVGLPLLAKAYDWYSFNLLPKMGAWIAGDAESYQYLAESIRMHPDQETLKSIMQDAGFEDVTYHNLTGGIVSIHVGFKY